MPPLRSRVCLNRAEPVSSDRYLPFTSGFLLIQSLANQVSTLSHHRNSWPRRCRVRFSSNTWTSRPALPSSFFQLTRPLTWASVFFEAEPYAPSTEPITVRFFLNDSGLRVSMSTVPAAPPSVRSACELL